MYRIGEVCERNAVADAPQVTVVPVNTPTTVIADDHNLQGAKEILLRTIQNVGSNATFYCHGQTAPSGDSYHGILAAGATLKLNHRLMVSCFSVAGTTIATTVIRRIENSYQSNNPSSGG